MEPQSSHFSKEKTGLSPGKKSKHTPLSVPLNVVRTLDQMQGAATWKWAQTKTTMNYHITCWKGHYQKVKKKKITSMVRMWRKGNHCILLAAMSINVAIMENSMEVT
jgi:hypothetical protein